MTQTQLIKPLLHPDATTSKDVVDRIGAMLRAAPPSYSGKRRAIAVSCEFIPVQSQRQSLAILPLFDFSVHRHYANDDIAGQALYDELNPLEKDHFEPVFRILHGHDISILSSDPLLSEILTRNAGRRMTLAYLENAIALFPSQVEHALEEIGPTPLEELERVDQGAICTLLVAPPTSHHARLLLSQDLVDTTVGLATILHGHMTTSFEDGHVRASPLGPSDFAQAAIGW